jgi:hypothetical protein
MPASPAASIPPLSPGEMQLLLSRAGLALNPGQVADLVLAWRQVAGLIAAMPHTRPLVDDMAFAFRLPPPASMPGPARSAAAATTSKTNAPAQRASPAGKKAKAKATAKPRIARPVGRKSGKRRR